MNFDIMSLGTRSGRSSNSNGRTTSNQDYTNLLFSDSDSDSRVPDLKLPPVKGKKQRKKRGTLGYRQDEASCGVGSVMKVFLLLVLFTVVAALAGISFWSMQKISSLQEKVDRLEQSDAFTPDSMTKFQTQLVLLNKSLTNLQSGEGGVKAVSASIKEIKAKLKTYEDTSVELMQAVASSKDLFDLPKKVANITTVLATMKNDVLTATSKQQELEQRLDALERDAHVTGSPVTESDMTRPDGQLVEQVRLLNLTMSQGFASINNRLDQHESEMSAMEELINKSATSSPVAPTLIDKLVKDVVQDYMGNITSPGSVYNGELDGLLKQVDGMVKEMKQIKSNGQDVISMGEYLVFKEDVMGDFKAINKTLYSFNNEFEEVFDHFRLLESKMKNITSFIQVVGAQLSDDNDDLTPSNSEENGHFSPSDSRNSDDITPENSGNDDASSNTQEDNGGDENSHLSTNDENKGLASSNPEPTLQSSKSTPANNDDNGVTVNESNPGDNNTVPDVNSTATVKTEKTVDERTDEQEESSSTPVANPIPTLQVESIKSMSDLVMTYAKIKPSADPLNMEELHALLSGQSNLTDEQLKSIDVNDNGLFSEMEIAAAMGFWTPSEVET